MKNLSLIIPVYNGAPYIADTILELIEFTSLHRWLQEVIFIDDGSIDQTGAILKAYRDKKYPFEIKIGGYGRNKGKAYAIKSAIPLLAHVDVVAFTDIELPYGLGGLIEAMSLLEKNDFVVGTRVGTHTPQYTRYRHAMTGLFRLLLPRQVRSIEDTQCGFKVFRTYIFRQLFAKIQTFRWVFDIELFVIARQHNMRFAKIPVQIKEKCLHKNGGVSFVKHGFYILQDLIKIYKNIALKKYD